jgi:predicted  nucleic acid-binding Zn-ribbon protein
VERSSLEERVAKIEGILEQMDKRLNHLESEIRDLRAYVEGEIKSLRAHVESEIKGLRAYFEGEIKGLRSEVVGEVKGLRGGINDLRRDLNNRFLWILGVQITMWVTIILAIIFR